MMHTTKAFRYIEGVIQTERDQDQDRGILGRWSAKIVPEVLVIYFAMTHKSSEKGQEDVEGLTLRVSLCKA